MDSGTDEEFDPPAARSAPAVPATLIQRIVANVVDAAILLPWALLLALAMEASVRWGSNLPTVLAAVLVVPWQVGMLARRGGTPGKLLMGLRVVCMDGSPLGTAQAWNRMALFYASLFLSLLHQGAVLGRLGPGTSLESLVDAVGTEETVWVWPGNVAILLVWVSAFLVLVRGDRRGLHDLWSDSIVVRVLSRPSKGS